MTYSGVRLTIHAVDAEKRENLVMYVDDTGVLCHIIATLPKRDILDLCCFPKERLQRATPGWNGRNNIGYPNIYRTRIFNSQRFRDFKSRSIIKRKWSS